MKLEHAPGPYMASRGKYGWQIHTVKKTDKESSHWLANIKCESCPVYEDGTAALFAAAPELLKSLAAFVRLQEEKIKNPEMVWPTWETPLLIDARAAIAKAEGRA